MLDLKLDKERSLLAVFVHCFLFVCFVTDVQKHARREEEYTHCCDLRKSFEENKRICRNVRINGRDGHTPQAFSSVLMLFCLLINHYFCHHMVKWVFIFAA